MDTLKDIVNSWKTDNDKILYKNKSIDDMYNKIHFHRNKNSGHNYLSGGTYETAPKQNS